MLAVLNDELVVFVQLVRSGLAAHRQHNRRFADTLAEQHAEQGLVGCSGSLEAHAGQQLRRDRVVGSVGVVRGEARECGVGGAARGVVGALVQREEGGVAFDCGLKVPVRNETRKLAVCSTR